MPTIACILHGSLEDSIVGPHDSNRTTLHFDQQPSVDDILAHLKLDRDYLQFFLADGLYVELEDWDKPVHGKLFQLWPRMSGG